MLNAQHKLDLVRAEADKARLTFHLTQAQADMQALRSELAKHQAAKQFEQVSEAALAAEKNELRAQRELAERLGKAYSVNWDEATWSPETGEITTDLH